MSIERIKRVTKHIHEGRFVGDVDIDLHYKGGEWDPTIALPDVEKIDRVRRALRQGDVVSAVKEAKVFELLPLAGE